MTKMHIPNYTNIIHKPYKSYNIQVTYTKSVALSYIDTKWTGSNPDGVNFSM